MPKIFKRLAQAMAEPYQFPDAKELTVELPPRPRPAPDPDPDFPDGPGDILPDLEETPEEDPVSPEEEPIRFAQIQADSILEDARRRADEIVAQAVEEARREADQVREAARLEGHREGREVGLEQGRLEAMDKMEELAAQQIEEVKRFLEKAETALERQLDDNVEELRDLALAVAEKVLSISLRSSSEVICRMIQTAVDKRKRQEWVHIYIAECDAKRMGQVPASLMATLSSLSDRVRIIPMADDEPGACIIETPEEIVDASASTQLSNLRGLLMDAPPGPDFGSWQFGGAWRGVE